MKTTFTPINYIYIFLLCAFGATLVPFSASAQNALRVPVFGNETVGAAPGSVITHSGAADRYEASANGSLTVLPEFEGGVVELRFEDVNLECQADHIIVFDGLNDRAPIHRIVSCFTPEFAIKPSAKNASGALTIKFVSDAFFSKGGFKITANTVCKSGQAITKNRRIGKGEPVTLQLTDVSQDAEIQWTASFDQGNSWQPLSGGTSMDYTLLSLEQNAWFRAEISCGFSQSEFSSIAMVQVEEPTVADLKDDANSPFMPCTIGTLQLFQDETIICPGGTVELRAEAGGVDVDLETFESGCPDGSFWSNISNSVPCGSTVSTNGSQSGVTSTLCNGPSPSGGNNYLYMASAGNTRVAETQDFCAAQGFELTFDFRYHANGMGPGTCESADNANEAVHVEYSLDDGVTWTRYRTLPPSTGNCTFPGCPPSFSWATYTDNIPVVPPDGTIRVRFIQDGNSGTCCDQWSIDNVSFTGLGCGGTFAYEWEPNNLVNTPFDSLTTTPPLYPDPSNPGGTREFIMTATYSQNGCTLMDTLEVDFYPSTLLINRAPGTPQCPGQAVTLIGANGSNFQWGVPPVAVGPTFVVNPTTQTTYTATGLSLDGCPDTATVTVDVLNQPPNITFNPSNPVKCANDPAITIQALLSGGSNWEWRDPSGTVISTTDQVTVNPATTTTYSVFAQDGNGCSGTQTITVQVNPNPSQPVYASGNLTPCQNTTGNYSVQFVPNVNFTWTMLSPGGPTITQFPGLSQTDPVTWNVPPGNYQIGVTPELNGCQGDQLVLDIEVLGPPTGGGPINGDDEVCTQETATYSVPAIPLVNQYSWFIRSVGPPQGPLTQNPALLLSPNNTGPAPAGVSMDILWDVTPGDYEVVLIPSNICAQGAPIVFPVTVVGPPSQPILSAADRPVCPGDTGAYEVIDLGFDYDWSLVGGGNIISGQGTSLIEIEWDANANFGNYNISVTPTDRGCVGQTLTIGVLMNEAAPPTPGPITGATLVCQNNTAQYRIDPVPRTLSYVWQSNLPAGADYVGAFTGAGATQVTIDWGTASPGFYPVCVEAQNFCGVSQQCIDVEVKAIPDQPGPIAVPPFHCLTTAETYEINSVPGADQYNWSNTCGTWSGASTDTFIDYTASAPIQACTIEVTAENVCGVSPARAVQVTPIREPDQPVANNIDSPLCRGDVGSYSVVNVPGVTYDWSGLPPGAQLITGQGTNQVTVDWGNLPIGTYTFNVTPNNNCGPGTPLSIQVAINTVPDQPTPISGATQLCQDATEIYDVNFVSGVTYQWDVVPAGAVLTATGNSLRVDWINPGNYTVIVTPSNQCGPGQARFLAVEVAERPVPNAGADRVVCGPNTVLKASPVGGTWSCSVCPPPANIVTAGPFGIVSDMTPDQHVFTYSINDPICGLVSDDVVVVNDLPIPGAVSSDVTVCAGTSVTLNLGGQIPASRINYVGWELSTDNFQTAQPISNFGTTYGIPNASQTAQYRAVMELDGFCPPIHSAHATVTVIPNDIANPQPTFLTTCEPTARIQANVPSVGTATWTFVNGPANAQIVKSAGEGIISGMTLPGDYTFRYEIDNPTCGINSQDVVVRVAEEDVADAGPNQQVCDADAVVQGNTPSQGNIGRWEFITGPQLAHVSAAGNNGTITNMDVPGSYTFRWVIENTACGTESMDEVIIERVEEPDNAIAGSPRDVCQSTASVIGNVPQNGTGTWSFVSGPVNASINTAGPIGTIFGMDEPGDYVFRWTISNGVCPDEFSDVTLTRINAADPAAITTPTLDICEQNQATVEAVAPQNGTGVWSFMQGPVNASIVTNGTTGLAQGMTADGTYIFRWTVTTGCGANFADVTINRYSQPSVPVYAGNDQIICEGERAVVYGSEVPSGWQGFWNFVSGPSVANVATFGRFGSIVNMTQPGSYVFSWNVTNNGVCPSQSSEVTITRVQAPTVASAGGNKDICGTTTNLVGNVPTVGTGQWTFVSGPKVASVSATGNAAVVGGMNIPGDYRFQYVISNPPCPASASEVVVNVSTGTDGGNLSGAGTVCEGSNSGTITLSGFKGDIVRWEVSNDDFATFSVLNNTTQVQNYTNLTQSTSYRVLVKEGACQEEYSNITKITVLPSGGVANAGSDQSICGTNTIVFGNNPTNGTTGTWRFVSGPANAQITQSGNLGIISGMSVSGDYIFEWEVNSGNCGNTVDQVIISASTGSDAGSLTGGATVCSGSNNGTIQLSGFNGDIVRWETSTDGFLTIGSATNTTPSLTYNNLTQTTSYRVVVKDGVCPEVVSNPVRVVVVSGSATANAGPDQEICGSSVTLSGGNPGAGIATWTFVDGPTTPAISQNGTELSVTGMTQAGDYTFRYEVDNSACGTTFDEVVVSVTGVTVPGVVQSTTTVCASGNNGTLSLNGFEGDITRWEFSTDNWLTVNAINNTTSLLDYQNLTQTTQYRAVVKTGNCPEARSIDATIYVVPETVPADAGPDVTTCGASTTIVGNNPPSGTLTWSYVSGPNAPQLIQSGNLLILNGLGQGVTTLKYEIDNSPCGVSEDFVQIDVRGDLDGGSVSQNQTVCAGNNGGALSLAGHNGNIIRWESSTDAFLTASSINNTSTTQVFTNLTQTTWYRAVVGLPGCGEEFSVAARIEVVGNAAIADAGPDQDVCSATAMLNGNNPGNGMSMWSFVSGPVVANVNTSGTQGMVNGMTQPGKYIFRYTIDNGSCGSNSSEVEVNVSAQTIPGNVSTSTPAVCGVPNSGSISLAGNTGNVVRWERSMDGQQWNPVNTQATSLTFVDIMQDMYYRAIVQNGVCSQEVTNSVMITYLDNAVGGVVSSDQTVCSGANNGDLTLSGNSGSVSRWEFNLGAGWIPISNSSNVESYLNLTQTTQYRAIVNNPICGNVPSAAATVTVEPMTVGGNVTGAATVCSGGNSGSLTLVGNVGNVLRWESADDALFTQNVSTINNPTTTQSYANLTQTKFYRAYVQSGGCMPQYSTVAEVTVLAAANGGVVTGAATVCATANSGSLTLGGFNGNVVRWESSTNNFAAGSVTNIANTTAVQAYNNLTQTTCYRAIVQTGSCAEVQSTVACVTVSPATVGGTLSADQTVCAGTNSGMVTLTGNVGNVVRWEASNDNFAVGSPITTVNNTTNMWAFSNLTQDTQVRAVVKSGDCNEEFSNVVSITVTPGSVGGSLAGATSVCGGSTSGTLTLSGQTGNVVRWESSKDNVTWNSVNNTTTSLSYNVNQTTWYRAVVQNGNCNEAFSGVARVEVSTPATAGTLAGAQTVCGGANNGTLTVTGTIGNIVRWESSTDPNFAPAATTNLAITGNTFSYSNLTQTTYFRVVVQSGACPETFSNVVAITVGSNITLNAASSTGCNDVGSITAIATGGSGSYQYSLSPAVLPSNSNGRFVGVSQGQYTITVDDGNCSASATVTVSGTQTGAEIVSITNVTSSSALVRWTDVPPGVSNGVRYNIRYRAAGNSTWTTISSQTTTFRFLSGLSESTSYEVQVQYLCPGSSIPSAWSATATFSTLAIRGGASIAATKEANVKVYPNPNRGDFTVSFDTPRAGEVTVRLLDVQGRAVATQTREANVGVNDWRLSEQLTAGVYILNVSQGDDVNFVKVVIE